jgi:hypothetical protein
MSQVPSVERSSTTSSSTSAWVCASAERIEASSVAVAL